MKDKQALVKEVLAVRAANPGFHYQKTSTYDYLVRQLFNKFHRLADTLDITFSERGNKDRTQAFQTAINAAELDFESSYGVALPIRKVRCSTPHVDAGLQAVDYFLWALQRFYEKQETRFLSVVWPQVGEITDLDFANPATGRGATHWHARLPLTREARFPLDKKKRPRI